MRELRRGPMALLLAHEGRSARQVRGTAEGAARVQRRSVVIDLPRVMRLPGFLHRKGQPFLCRVVSVDGRPPCKMADFPGEKPLPPELLAALRHAGAGIVRESRASGEAENGCAAGTCPRRSPRSFPRQRSAGHRGIASELEGPWSKLQGGSSMSPLGVRRFGAESGILRSTWSCSTATKTRSRPRLAARATGAEAATRKRRRRRSPTSTSTLPGAPSERWLIKDCLPETGVATPSGQWGVYKTFTASTSRERGPHGRGLCRSQVQATRRRHVRGCRNLQHRPIRLAALVKGQMGQVGQTSVRVVDSSPPLRTRGRGCSSTRPRLRAALLDLWVRSCPSLIIVVDTLVAAAEFESENEGSA